MKACVVLNRDGGTLKTTDLAEYKRHLEAEFSSGGHQLTVNIVSGRELLPALEEAAGDDSIDSLIAGGGDGTISAAAALAWKGGKALGVLPAGTMNLFARSLGVPLDIMAAATALSRGSVASADIATADGQAFVHQFSVGMQSRVVVERNKANYGSRLGKIMASTLATLSMLARPPAFAVRMSVDGKPVDCERFSAIAVSNNPYGEGHMPYADRVDAGLLGVYYAPTLDLRGSLRLAVDIALGAWGANPDFVTGSGQEVVLEFPRLKRSARAVIDGEVVKLKPRTVIRTHPGELKVVMPAPPPAPEMPA